MKKRLIILLLLLPFSLCSCSISQVKKETTNAESKTKKDRINIVRYPAASVIGGGKLDSLPKYNPSSKAMWQVDLRGYDLSSLDISSRLDDLMYADYDSKTKWPEKLPEGFNPEDIMELGVNPGLKIKELHRMGITGKGIGVAIIDQALLVEHDEYKDNLKMYEEIHWPKSPAQMHGPAVASIAVGKTAGVAPDADLYYIAEQHGEFKNSYFNFDFTWLAQSIDRILEVNKTLPKKGKIRVISISVGWDKSQKGYDEVTAAVNRAKQEGIFVVSSSLTDTYGYIFNGLGRDSLMDPEKASSYKAGWFWENTVSSYGSSKAGNPYNANYILLVPMDSRTTASPTGINDYVFYRTGGLSWSIPYIAGLYALACQVDPAMTPDKFWETSLNTGDRLNVNRNGKDYYLGKIVNPIKLMDEIKK